MFIATSIPVAKKCKQVALGHLEDTGKLDYQWSEVMGCGLHSSSDIVFHLLKPLLFR
jgi:hypothetical protein